MLWITTTKKPSIKSSQINLIRSWQIINILEWWVLSVLNGATSKLVFSWKNELNKLCFLWCVIASFWCFDDAYTYAIQIKFAIRMLKSITDSKRQEKKNMSISIQDNKSIKNTFCFSSFDMKIFVCNHLQRLQCAWISWRKFKNQMIHLSHWKMKWNEMKQAQISDYYFATFRSVNVIALVLAPYAHTHTHHTIFFAFLFTRYFKACYTCIETVFFLLFFSLGCDV